MSNIKNYYFNNIDIKLTNSDYWDLFLCYDERLYNKEVLYCNSIFSGSSLISYFDFNNPQCILDNTIYSLDCWDGSTLPISGLSLCDIGLTGVDNGFVKNLTGETLNILSGDCRLFLTRVSGLTYNYDWSMLNDVSGNYINLCGGFFQGFWKLQGFDYQVLPKRMRRGWSAEFWLYKSNDCLSGITNTLNDIYPNNKGFFFYLGARSENKFWNLFSGESGYTTCDGLTTIIPNPVTIDPVDVNSFLYNSCSCGNSNCKNKSTTGSTNCCFNPYDVYGDCGDPCGGCGTSGCDGNCNESRINGFIVNSSTTETLSCSAYTIYNKNPESDVIDNNLGFRIKDDGSIGYRKIVYSANCRDCCVAITGSAVSGISIVEQYSISGMVENNKWTHVAIVFKRYCEYDCVESEKYPPFPDCKKGKLLIFVNGYLKLSINDFDEVLFRDFDESKYKVEGVPYNISIGGGTQGLIESQTFNGPDLEDKNLLLEQYFAGTFIGGISKFRLYEVPLDVTEIRCNFNSEKDIYK
jgi:hypothetical protein